MPQDHERRKHVRRAVLLPCHVDGLPTGTMQVIDVSEGGCFIATRQAVTAGSRIAFYATLAGRELLFAGRIVHVKPGRGFAVEFVNLAVETRNQLHQFLDQVLTTG